MLQIKHVVNSKLYFYSKYFCDMSAKLLFYFLEKIMQGNCGKDVFAK